MFFSHGVVLQGGAEKPSCSESEEIPQTDYEKEIEIKNSLVNSYAFIKLCNKLYAKESRKVHYKDPVARMLIERLNIDNNNFEFISHKIKEKSERIENFDNLVDKKLEEFNINIGKYIDDTDANLCAYYLVQFFTCCKLEPNFDFTDPFDNVLTDFYNAAYECLDGEDLKDFLDSLRN